MAFADDVALAGVDGGFFGECGVECLAKGGEGVEF